MPQKLAINCNEILAHPFVTAVKAIPGFVLGEATISFKKRDKASYRVFLVTPTTVWECEEEVSFSKTFMLLKVPAKESKHII